MPTKFVRRGPGLDYGQVNSAKAAPIYVDSVTGLLKYGNATTGVGVQSVLAALTATKTIVDGAATSLFEIPVAAGAYVSGTIDFTVFASDGTDHQALTGVARFSAVNKAGVCTRTITYVTTSEAKAVSSGTLTLAFTLTDDTNKVTVKLQPTGSLTETTYTIAYRVNMINGTPTIL